MNNFFRAHSETVLISSAILFLVVIAGFLYGTLNVVFSEIDRAIGSVSVQSASGFDLQSAARIDFRGLLGGDATQTSQSQIVLPVPFPLPVSTPVSTPTPTSTIITTTTNSIVVPAATSVGTTSINGIPASSTVNVQIPGMGTTTAQ
jgi:hypothetical protein